MVNKIIIGIDPGQKGGIAALINNKYRYMEIPRQEDKRVDIIELTHIFAEMLREGQEMTIAIEKQHAFPQQGAVSTSKIVGEFERIETTAILFSAVNPNTRVVTVNARSWQKKIYNPTWNAKMGKERSIMAYKERIGPELPKTKSGRAIHMGFLEAGLIALSEVL